MEQTLGQVIGQMQEGKKALFPLHFRVRNARVVLQTYLNKLIPNAQWLQGYDDIAAWLSDNEGKGLLLLGGCGVGKTVIATKIIPHIVDYLGRYVSIHKAFDLADNKQLEEIKYYRHKVIDDIGTESEMNDYGIRRFTLVEVVDKAEARDDFLVLTTNLTGKDIRERYGERTFDRLRSICKVVTIEGASLRK